MSYTKREFVVAAFGEIGLASYVFDLTPDQLQDALNKLDAMMATWNALGIRVGYPLPSSPSASSLDTDTGCPDSVNETVYQNLAIRLAPGYGKTASMDTRLSAKQGYLALLSKYQGAPPEMQLPGSMPAGAGNKRWNVGNSPFINPPSDPMIPGQDGVLDFDD